MMVVGNGERHWFQWRHAPRRNQLWEGGGRSSQVYRHRHQPESPFVRSDELMDLAEAKGRHMKERARCGAAQRGEHRCAR